MVRRFAFSPMLFLLVPFLALAAGCASKTDVGTSTVQRQQINYDSTRDGPRMFPEVPDAPDIPGALKPKKCLHAWEAVRDGTHSYMDESGDMPMPALCTPMVCTKCGLVRHECEWHQRR